MKDLIEKAIAKATGHSQNDVTNKVVKTITLKQATEAIQWAIETNHDVLLGQLREALEDMNHPKDIPHSYGFSLAVDIVNDFLD